MKIFGFVKRVFFTGLTILSGFASVKFVELYFNEWHKTCKCECKFGANVCNNKECWNKDKCRCKSKELIDKGVRDKGFIWNPNNCECECDKAYDVGKYLA